jgi:hypothetical protein
MLRKFDRVEWSCQADWTIYSENPSALMALVECEGLKAQAFQNVFALYVSNTCSTIPLISSLTLMRCYLACEFSVEGA